MARRHLLLQLLPLAAVSLLLLRFPSPMHRSPPPSSFLKASTVDAAPPSTDSWAAVPHGAVDVNIPGSSRRLGPRHRTLSDVPAYAEARDPAASSSEADAPGAAPSSSSADSGVLHLLDASPVHNTPASPVVVVSRRLALGTDQLRRHVLLDVPAGAPAPAPEPPHTNMVLNVLAFLLVIILLTIVGLVVGGGIIAIVYLICRCGAMAASFVADKAAAARAARRMASERVHPDAQQDAGGAAGP